MEKRKVTVMIAGHRCSFYSDDSEAYLSALEQRANHVMRQTARYSGLSFSTNALLSVISLTDALMRAEQGKAEAAKVRAETGIEAKKESGPDTKPESKPARKKAEKPSMENKSQISVWELLDEE